MSQLDQLKQEIEDHIQKATDLKVLDDIRVDALGKKGRVTSLLRNIPNLPPEERRDYGQAVNDLKGKLAEAIQDKEEALRQKALEARLATETVDVSLDARLRPQGTLHPITQTLSDMVDIFSDMGFEVATGPDLEDDFHNFTALNFPENHPARQMHDTFYMTPDEEGADPKLLRTHTSTVQIRVMKDKKPPLKIIVPGRTYRSDYDQTHTPMFHQLEGLVIDKKTHMGHLKGTLIEFCRQMFELDDLPVRFRPSFFPFTEPSAEVDIGCSHSKDGLAIGAGDGWMEILGCGMVHPNVIKNCGLDPDEYQGYAFGMGIERIAMLKYGIPDLRSFFEGDIRWLKHYGFSLFDA